MFETLSKKMTDAFSVISPKSSLTEDNIQQAVKDIRVGLLEADVALSVIDDFISKISCQKYRNRKHLNESFNFGQI